jgi:hypothetical protein
MFGLIIIVTLSLVIVFFVLGCSQAETSNYETFYKGGIHLSKSGKHEESLVAFDRALQINSNSYEALCDRVLYSKFLDKKALS